MTDPADTQPFFSDADAADAQEQRTEAGGGPTDDELRDLDRSNDAPAGGDRPDEEGPGAPGNAEPMTESTDGGLGAGDPGVEE